MRIGCKIQQNIDTQAQLLPNNFLYYTSTFPLSLPEDVYRVVGGKNKNGRNGGAVKQPSVQP